MLSKYKLRFNGAVNNMSVSAASPKYGENVIRKMEKRPQILILCQVEARTFLTKANDSRCNPPEVSTECSMDMHYQNN